MLRGDFETSLRAWTPLPPASPTVRDRAHLTAPVLLGAPLGRGVGACTWPVTMATAPRAWHACVHTPRSKAWSCVCQPPWRTPAQQTVPYMTLPQVTFALNLTGDNGFMSIDKRSWQLPPEAVRPNCPTAQLSNCPTAQLPNCPTAQLSRSAAHGFEWPCMVVDSGSGSGSFGSLHV